MSQTISEFLDRLTTRLSLDKAAAWDVSGLQLGDPDRPVGTIAVCHEVTDEVVVAVSGSAVDLLIAYHPLLFRPTTRLVAGRGPEGRALRLAENRTALAVLHTAFDVVAGGTADALAAALDLVDVTGFGMAGSEPAVKVVTFVPSDHVEAVAAAMQGAGAGVIGGYSGCSFRSQGEGAFIAGPGTKPVVGSSGLNREPETRIEMITAKRHVEAVVAAMVGAHPYEEPAFDVYDTVSNQGFVGRVGGFEGRVEDLASRAAERLGAAGMRVSGHGPIERVAVVPGSGTSFLSAAAAVGADAIVTGDVPHHRVIEATDRGMAVVDPGHAATERPGITALADLVDAIADATVIDLTGIDPTPWR